MTHSKLNSAAKWCRFIAASVCFAATQASVAAPIDIVVPAYFYPSFSGSDWDRLTSAAQSGVAITAIMNPGSGPGIASNSDYVSAVGRFRAAGGKVLGYIPSGYLGDAVNAGSTCQPASGSNYSVTDIVTCAARYQAYYAIDGIFVDEFGKPAGGASDAAVLGFYQQIYTGLTNVNASWQIVGNAGTDPVQGLLRSGASGSANRLVTFENDGAAFAAASSAAWTQTGSSQPFIQILYNVSATADLNALVAQVAARNVSGLYITDDVLPNPYDTLPIYWDRLLGAVKDFNATQINAAVPVPGSAALLIAGVLAMRVRSSKKSFNLADRPRPYSMRLSLLAT